MPWKPSTTEHGYLSLLSPGHKIICWVGRLWFYIALKLARRVWPSFLKVFRMIGCTSHSRNQNWLKLLPASAAAEDVMWYNEGAENWRAPLICCEKLGDPFAQEWRTVISYPNPPLIFRVNQWLLLTSSPRGYFTGSFLIWFWDKYGI